MKCIEKHIKSISPLISSARVKRAFTLLELMIVVSLVGVVSSVASVNFAATANRMKYNDYVRRIYSIFAQARTQAILTNSAQRVVCNFDAQSIERHGQKINEERTGYDESIEQSLDIPLLVCEIEKAEEVDNENSEENSGGAYTFLPDGLGNEYKALDVNIIQGKKLNRQLYWELRRDSRGRLVLSGPKRVGD